MNRRRLLLIAAGVPAAVLVLLLAAVLAQDSAPWTATEVRGMVDRLNEQASTKTPHESLMTPAQRAENQDLLDRVEAGSALSSEDGDTYRRLYQSVLRDKRPLLARFDADLTVRTDLRMDEANNLGGHGVPDDHDHHDDSALRNFDAMQRSLVRIRKASGLTGSPMRVRDANSAYKNLTDIILHMATAPHTVSVGYAPSRRPGSALEVDFNAMMQAYKAAQFSPINSPVYVARIHEALAAYDRLVLGVQSVITSELAPIERRLAGRWLAPHTLSPRPDADVAVRFPRGAVE